MLVELSMVEQRNKAVLCSRPTQRWPMSPCGMEWIEGRFSAGFPAMRARAWELFERPIGSWEYAWWPIRFRSL